ncbi:MAG: polysaccharide biosynthesis C-terminal domain-containing protein [Flavobacteriaceae bacterium]|nr:polysaccharide biosynthesis C-terminal domain-containing protein [Flavobacteriaceae bacterium]
MLSYIYFFKVDDTLYIYYLIGFSYLIKTSAVLEYYILAKKWSKIIFISKISSLIVIVSLQYYVVQKGFSVYYFALIIAFDLLIRVSFYIFILLKKNSININQWVFSKVLAKYLFKNSYKLMIANLIIGFYITIDEILLKYYHGDSANGVFSVVQYLVIVLTWNIGFSIINSLYPSLAESYRTNKREYYNKLKSITVIMIVFGVLTAIFYMFSAKYILNTFFSEEYQKAIIPLRIFCWAPLFVFIGMIYEKHLININKLQNNIYRFVIGCVVNVILCVLLIPKWEIVGVAIAVLLSHFITNIVCIFIFKNNLKVLR